MYKHKKTRCIVYWIMYSCIFYAHTYLMHWIIVQAWQLAMYGPRRDLCINHGFMYVCMHILRAYIPYALSHSPGVTACNVWASPGFQDQSSFHVWKLRAQAESWMCYYHLRLHSLNWLSRQLDLALAGAAAVAGVTFTYVCMYIYICIYIYIYIYMYVCSMYVCMHVCM